MTDAKAMIAGCATIALTPEEIAMFAEHKPWGLILFARNIGTADEIRALTAHFRELVGRENAPVFIDQEGGRVQRIKAPITQIYPSGAALGEIYKKDKNEGMRVARMMSKLHAADLLPLGINADCLPVLDVPVEGSHDVIGNRAYGHTPQAVADMGLAAAEGLLEGGVLPVIKHIPGHGRALVDSHKDLPIVDTSAATLRAHDFEPFKQLKDMPMAMTAHVIYTALDAKAPATTSKYVIETIIRGEIGFNGLLMTDDLSMHALSGDFCDRAQASFAAGCDVVLHCNGAMHEMLPVCEVTPTLSGRSLDRANAATDLLKAPQSAAQETAALREEFNALVSAFA
ncbi:beta-N-acetylhexosaminidase [Ahrensia kielensis]|uniref:beta-N-acetylhexosaminidase n=1 Tax=Ahrensia kielensis TaxID=76980 RepID=UPI0003790E50|nr:beta-N-acetylhexosaminidase [Ahrensia kielensis]